MYIDTKHNKYIYIDSFLSQMRDRVREKEIAKDFLKQKLTVIIQSWKEKK